MQARFDHIGARVRLRTRIGVRIGVAAALVVLTLVDDLGFRPSDPCYEQKPAGTATEWTPKGQEQGFAASHSLLVATTAANATIWQQQLLAGSGVAKIDVGPATNCG